jgi:ABC-type molybdenum transport system ATPase subunit/photorepair protein PhrA
MIRRFCLCELKHVRGCSYSEDKMIVRDVSCAINKNSRIAILGVNGAGMVVPLVVQPPTLLGVL